MTNVNKNMLEGSVKSSDHYVGATSIHNSRQMHVDR